jgi:3-isopropylmalate dehydratase small subunit
MNGRVWKFGDDVNTDVICPTRFIELGSGNLGPHLMEGVRPGFASLPHRGDFLVAGRNFGSGSSRETAVLAIKEVGLSAVIASSFSRIFYRNAVNNGLIPILLSEEAYSIQEGDFLSVDLMARLIKNRTQDTEIRFSDFPPVIRSILEKGGLVPYLKWSRSREVSK